MSISREHELTYHLRVQVLGTCMILLTDLNSNFLNFMFFRFHSAIQRSLVFFLVTLTITLGEINMSPSSHKHSALILRLLWVQSSAYDRRCRRMCATEHVKRVLLTVKEKHIALKWLKWEKEPRIALQFWDHLGSCWDGWILNWHTLSLSIVTLVGQSVTLQGLAPDLRRSGAAVMPPVVPQNRPSMRHRTHAKCW